MESHRSVQLGCGTLVIIVIIVVVFGNVAAQDLQRDMNSLRNEMRALRDSVRVLQQTVEELREAVAPAQGAAEEAPTPETEYGDEPDETAPRSVLRTPAPPLPVNE